MEHELNAKGEYTRLSLQRSPFLERALIASALTLPALLPRRNSMGEPEQNIPTTFQSVGARGVNNLSSKLLLALFPTSPFFRLLINRSELPEAAEDEEVENDLLKLERIVMSEMEVLGLRVPLFEAVKHLVVSGNICIYLPNKPEDGNMRIFHMDSYVVDRDPDDNLLQLIIQERLHPSALPDSAREALEASETYNPKPGDTDYVELFTWVKWNGETEKFDVHQEVGPGIVIESSVGSWEKNDLPYSVIRMSSVAGQAWGRGIVEDYEGDLRSLEGLAIGILEGVAASVRVLFFVNPNGFTNIQDLQNRPNGAIVPGFAEDVSSFQADKQADLQVAASVAQTIETRLSRAFLLNSAITRSAERVTAQEVRFQAEELEATLGGVYAILTRELQVPLIRRMLARVQAAGFVPTFKDNLIRPAIITGIEALNRGQELQNLMLASQAIGQTYGPEAVNQYTNPLVGIKRYFTAAGVDTDKLMRTEEELAASAQAAQSQELIQSVAPVVAGNVTRQQGN